MPTPELRFENPPVSFEKFEEYMVQSPRIQPDDDFAKALFDLGFDEGILDLTSDTAEYCAQVSYFKRNLPPPTQESCETEEKKKYLQFKEPCPEVMEDYSDIMVMIKLSDTNYSNFKPHASLSTGACLERELVDGGGLSYLVELFNFYVECPPDDGPLHEELLKAIRLYRLDGNPGILTIQVFQKLFKRSELFHEILTLICRRELDPILSHKCKCPLYGPYDKSQLELHPQLLLKSIPEHGARIRTAGMSSCMLNYLASYVQSIGLEYLRQHEEFDLPMKGISKTTIENLCSRFSSDEVIMSSDQVGATDNFNQNLCYFAYMALLDKFGRAPQWMYDTARICTQRFTILQPRSCRRFMMDKLIYDKFMKLRKEPIDSIELLLAEEIADLPPTKAYLSVLKKYGIEAKELLWSETLALPARYSYYKNLKRRSDYYDVISDPSPRIVTGKQADRKSVV